MVDLSTRSILRLVGLYIVLACTWILVSDVLLARLVSDSALLSELQSVKGWLFVVVTGGLLFVLLERKRRSHKDAVDELTVAEASLRAISEHLEDYAIFLLDADGAIANWNESAARLTGRTQPEALGQPLALLFAKEDADVAERAFRGAAETGHHSWQAWCLRADGERFYADCELLAVWREENRPVGAVVIVRDVTERWRSQQALLDSEQRYRRLVETAEEGIWLIDADSRTTFVNPKMAQMLGYTVDEMTGRQVFDFMDDEGRAITQTNLARRRQGVREQHEFRFVRKDGSNLWTLLATCPIVDGNGVYEGALAMVTDITARRAAEDAVRANEARLRAIIDTEPECVKLVGGDGRLIEMNNAGLEMLEVDSLEQAQQRPLIEYVAPEHRESFDALARRVLRGERGELEFEMIGVRGTQRWVRSRVVSLKDERTGETQLLGVTHDITERRRNEERLSYLTQHDGLTGLPNRTLFTDRLEQAMIEAERHERLVGVVFLDIDRFKNVNDSMGHDAGDALLTAVAQRLGGAVRRGDTVARLSGDEFTIILADMGHVDDATRVAQKILDTFSKPFTIDGRELFVTVSLGVTLYPFDDIDADGLLRNADVAMYRAKEAGRNTYAFYAAEMTAKAADYLALENDLRLALDRGELSVHYQPIVRCKGLQVIGAEALLRWTHPKRGPIPPSTFIPIAEDTGLIHALGDWVLKEACRQCYNWRTSGMPDMRVSVNLSPRQLRDPRFPKRLKALLDESGCDGSWLELELTESVLLHGDSAVVQCMSAVTGMGVTFSIDDFGTGYSSLTYLKRFPVSQVKIDRSFTQDIPHDADDAAIATAIIGMAHALDMRVVAEGIETEAQLEFLRAHKCDAGQGYLIGRPEPAIGSKMPMAAAKAN